VSRTPYHRPHSGYGNIIKITQNKHQRHLVTKLLPEAKIRMREKHSNERQLLKERDTERLEEA
jgi:hypothetical protein